jgi:hypothetical protein
MNMIQPISLGKKRRIKFAKLAIPLAKLFGIFAVIAPFSSNQEANCA